MRVHVWEMTSSIRGSMLSNDILRIREGLCRVYFSISKRWTSERIAERRSKCVPVESVGG